MNREEMEQLIKALFQSQTDLLNAFIDLQAKVEEPVFERAVPRKAQQVLCAHCCKFPTFQFLKKFLTISNAGAG